MCWNPLSRRVVFSKFKRWLACSFTGIVFVFWNPILYRSNLNAVAVYINRIVSKNGLLYFIYFIFLYYYSCSLMIVLCLKCMFLTHPSFDSLKLYT